LDPNVLVSAALGSSGPSAALLQAARERRYQLIASPHLLDELTGVLLRERFRSYIDLHDVPEYVAEIASIANTEPDPTPGGSLTRDPSDDYLVVLAREVEADLLVSGDKDLIAFGGDRPPILPPRAALERILGPVP
jgi:putative PIN family toxin of toxin-antitoxin system